MTPKDKAKELVDKFTVVGLQQRNEGIQCALICVDEMMSIYASALHAIGIEKHIAEITQSAYLQQVKKEIELIGK